MKKVELYTDGACSYNPGPGGYGFILIYKKTKKEFSGYAESATNNQMELTAVIEGLKKLKERCAVTIYTDSAYVLNAFEQKWIESWEQNNWKTSTKKPVMNLELWQQLQELVKKHRVTWVKVKGHSTVELNNRCDELARAEILKHAPQKQ